MFFCALHFCPMLQAYSIFEERFDHHVALQEAAHLRDQEEAKFHGKAKTKNLRWALLIHLVDQARTGVTLEEWSTQLTPGAIHAGNLIGDYCDAFGAKIADFFTGLVSGHVAMLPLGAQADPGRPAAAAVVQPRRFANAREHMRALITQDFATVSEVPLVSLTFVYKLAKAMIQEKIQNEQSLVLNISW